MPGYVQHCDVATVPFRRGSLVDAIHPIKVYEYLACGLPVVAIGWPELEDMGAPIELAERDDFREVLARRLAEGPGSAEQRVAYARANSWDVRFETVEAAIAAVLDGRKG